MSSWWHHLNLPLQFFYAIGFVAAVALAIEGLLTLLGMDHHSMPDVHVEHPDQFGMLSVRSITGFFFGFGWTGVIGLKAGLGLVVSMVLALAAGMVFLLGIYLLMRALFSMQASGTLDYKNAIGEIATVYVTVPAERAGTGQVEVMIQGRLQTIACLTPSPTPLAPQSKVKVVGLVDRGTLEVVPL